MAILSAASHQFVKHVRSVQFYEEVARGSLHLIAERLTTNPEAITHLETVFDVDMEIFSSDASLDNAHEWERLERGQVIVSSMSDDGAAVFLSPMPNGQRLQIKLSKLSKLQARATARLLLDSWQGSDIGIHDYLARLQPHFGYPLSVVDLADLVLSSTDFMKLEYGDVLVDVSKDGVEAKTLAKVPGSQNVVRLGPVATFNPYSLTAIIIIGTIGIMLIGLGVYWVVNTFETRLRQLEQATSRLSQGHLNARVSGSGEDAVGRLGYSFNKMAEHIQRLISIQREMVRAVSHELRTPVARIRFAAQIIEDSVIDDASVTKQLVGMDSDIQELNELIDEILTYARLEEGGPVLDFQKINIAEVAQQVVGEARPSGNVSVSFEGSDPEGFPFSEAESRYVHRAIQNLVGNAGRYARTRVKVHCTLSDGVCRVDVEDDGPGIPEEDWDRVFSAFARLDDSRTRASGGYGLGLSIVRRIMYWHGGQALAGRSNELGGARFSLIWPRIHAD